MLDTPHFEAYNRANADTQISFTPVASIVHAMRQGLVAEICVREQCEMALEAWTRALDCESFRYTNYLNEKGLILSNP